MRGHLNPLFMMQGLVYVLYIAAAVKDGTPAQKHAIRQARVETAAEFDRTGKMGPMMQRVQDIMGTEWTPSGDYAEIIEGLVRELQEAQR